QPKLDTTHRPTLAPPISSAAPHAFAATLIDSLLKASEGARRQARVVDISADFRYRSAAAYEAVSRPPHGSPARINAFSCAVPEHLRELTTTHVAHPGCFSTATLLA